LFTVGPAPPEVTDEDDSEIAESETSGREQEIDDILKVQCASEAVGKV